MKLLIFILLSVSLSARELSDYDQKVVNFFEEYGLQSDFHRLPKDDKYWKELKWIFNEGEKIRPAYMYLLTEKYANDYIRTSTLISCLANTPGDQSEVLEVVRHAIQRTDYDYTRYGVFAIKQACIGFLNRHGEQQDLKLLEPFLDKSEDVLLRSTATRAKQAILQRLKKNDQETKSSDTNALDDPSRTELPNQDKQGSEMLIPATKKPNKWPLWGILGGILVGFLAFLGLKKWNK